MQARDTRCLSHPRINLRYRLYHYIDLSGHPTRYVYRIASIETMLRYIALAVWACWAHTGIQCTHPRARACTHTNAHTHRFPQCIFSNYSCWWTVSAVGVWRVECEDVPWQNLEATIIAWPFSDMGRAFRNICESTKYTDQCKYSLKL